MIYDCEGSKGSVEAFFGRVLLKSLVFVERNIFNDLNYLYVNVKKYSKNCEKC